MAVVGWLVHGGVSCFIVELIGGGGELTIRSSRVVNR